MIQKTRFRPAIVPSGHGRHGNTEKCATMDLMNWNRLITNKRYGLEERYDTVKEDRTQFQRDYDRLIFSAPFRRMQNKTQVFPLPGSVFVHNRLTHSLEVSSVGRSLGIDTGQVLMKRHPELDASFATSLGAIVSAACLAHDLGNPPFGHAGEKAISSFFSEGEGRRLQDYVAPATGERLTPSQWNDITRFDGNANAFRILTHQFHGRRRGGFVMTYPTLAAIVKYPFSSSFSTKNKFGFFESERDAYKKIADEMGLFCLENRDGLIKYVRHPLAYLVEAADDICYEIMDIEDAYKLRLLTFDETRDLLLGFFEGEQRENVKNAYSYVTDENEKIVYFRSCVINCLEHECVRVFLENEKAILAGQFKGSLIDHIAEVPARAYKECSRVAVSRVYSSKDVLDIELAGYHIIYTLLGLMVEAVLSPEKKYSELLLSRVSSQYQINAPTLYGRIMAVIDFVSGMTDVFSLDMYRKINGTQLPMV